tara:strand:+ start:117 stop:410 length:294 start_codon:yes stop_codon:yes gene_type:complete
MTVTKSDFDPKCFGSQYQDPPDTLHFQFDGVRCDNYVYRYVLVDKFRPNKIDSRSKKTEEELGKSGKEIADGYLPLVLKQETKPGLIDKIKKIFSNG